MKFLFVLLIVLINYANGAAQLGNAILANRPHKIPQSIFLENFNNKKVQNNQNVKFNNSNKTQNENNFSISLNSENINPNKNRNSENYNKENMTKHLTKENNVLKTLTLKPINAFHVSKPLTENSVKHPSHLQTAVHVSKPLTDNSVKHPSHLQTAVHVSKPLTENSVKHPSHLQTAVHVSKPLTENSVKHPSHLQTAVHVSIAKQQTKENKLISKQKMSQNNKTQQSNKPKTVNVDNQKHSQHLHLHAENRQMKAVHVGNSINSQHKVNAAPNKTQHSINDKQPKKQLDKVINAQHNNEKHLQQQLTNESKQQQQQLQQRNKHLFDKRAKTLNIVNKDLVTADKKRSKTVHGNIDDQLLQVVNKHKAEQTKKNNFQIEKKVDMALAPTDPSHLIDAQTKNKQRPIKLRSKFSFKMSGSRGYLHDPTNKTEQVINVKQQQIPKSVSFLDFEELPKDGQTNREYQQQHNRKCKHFEKSEMKLVKIANEHGHVSTYNVFKKPISGGATSKVFHAIPIDAIDMDGSKITKCVAIKSVILDFDNASPDVIEGFEKEKEFLMKFRNNPNIKHIVHLHYMKKDYEKNRLIIILELGKHDLAKRMRLMRAQWKLNWGSSITSVDGQIEKVVRQVLEAVNEMHGKAIHLDLKSDNMLFVENNDATSEKDDEILKVIDFGGSEFIDPFAEKSNEASEVANVCRLRNGMWSDDRYSSPEQNTTACGKPSPGGTEQYTVSTKSDIWSIGIMLVEFLLLTPHFPEIDPIVSRGSSDESNIYNVVIGINHWHYSEIPPENEQTIQAMHYMTKLHEIFPMFFNIIKACLRINPKQRPTSKGILNFLNGKCQLKDFGDEKPADLPHLRHSRHFGRRKIRSVHPMFDQQQFELFSQKMLEQPTDQVIYCDLGKMSD